MTQFLRPISWKLPGLGMSNMSFLIVDVIQFVSGTMTTFLQKDGTIIRSKQFSKFCSRTITLMYLWGCLLLVVSYIIIKVVSTLL